MIKSLILNSIRSLIRQKPYSFINIIGLTIGVSSVLLLIIWITGETSYENFHKESERLFRVNMNFKSPNRIINAGSINAPAGPEFKREFPVVENMVRFTDSKESVIYKEKTSKIQVLYTDSTFFDMFSFDLIKGNKTDCLESPDGVVITTKAAQKIFGDEEPLGKEILMAGKTFIVTALAKDPPTNTNIQFECLAPLSFISRKMHIGWDGGLTCYTYLKLIKGADPAVLQQQITQYMKGVINDKYNSKGYALNPYLENIKEIHLDPDIEYDLGEKGSRLQIYLFSGVGLLILLIACFNFVNISTALSFKRSKEVSVRKIFGAERRNIILNFVYESAFAIIISLLLGFILTKILVPYTSNLIGKELNPEYIKPIGWILIFLSLLIFCTVFASFYSSFYLSSSNPLALLTTINKGAKKQISRNVLVTFQYTISIALIISCMVIYSQMQFVRISDKGFSEKNIMIINLNDKTSLSYELIKNKFASVPGILSVSVSAGGSPGLGFTSNGYMPEGFDKPVMANALYIDEDYLKTMGIRILEGRDFRNLNADNNKAIINQTFAKTTGWDQPIGKSISRNGVKYEIIGEVKDFYTSSMHNKIEPIFISTVNEWKKFDNIIIKYQPENLTELLKKTEKIIKETDPQAPFEYEFLEDSLISSYSGEQKLNILFVVLSGIALFISCLGLFGMATFTTQSRIKEISIRKINGAMISDIFWKFNFELLKWVFIAFIIASPLEYFAMTTWLSNFAYKTNISLWLIVASGIFAIIIGLLTVSWASVKAAGSNPVDALRKD